MNRRGESDAESGSGRASELAPPHCEYDLVIIGAGLAGLSLACWLLQLAEAEGSTLPRVCLLEPRRRQRPRKNLPAQRPKRPLQPLIPMHCGFGRKWVLHLCDRKSDVFII